jgi:hypothetical protein
LAPVVTTYDDDDTELEFFEEPETLESPRRPRTGSIRTGVAAMVHGVLPAASGAAASRDSPVSSRWRSR